MARSKKPKGCGRKPKQNKKTRHEVIDDQRHHRITNNQKYLQPIVIIDIEVTVMEMEEIREVMELNNGTTPSSFSCGRPSRELVVGRRDRLPEHGIWNEHSPA